MASVFKFSKSGLNLSLWIYGFSSALYTQRIQNLRPGHALAMLSTGCLKLFLLYGIPVRKSVLFSGSKFFLKLLSRRRNVFLFLAAIASIVTWSTGSLELSPSEKPNEKNRPKIVALLSAWTLSTLIMTISLFQTVQF